MLTNERMQEINDAADIVNVRFTKSVIASKEAFTYEAAQIRKDDVSVLSLLSFTHSLICSLTARSTMD